MAKLQVFFGGKLQSEFFLDGRDRALVGRAPDCDVVIDNLAVSRHHCILKGAKRQWVLEDNQSSNGTYVHGELITGPRTLKHGDRIVVGKHTLLFDFFDQAAADQLPEPEENQANPMAPVLDIDEGDKTHFAKLDALAQFRQRSQKEKPMVLVLEGRNRIIVPLESEVTWIGKGPDCDLRIEGWFIRNRQARIVRQRSFYKILHEGGWRSLQVNGSKTREAVLQTGDVIMIAGNRISFGSL